MALPQISTPTYTVELPVSKKVVKFRPFLVREEKVLMLALESQDPESMKIAMDTIVHDCTFGDVSVSEFQVADLETLFVHIRSKSVGETSRVVLKCEKCDEKNVVTLDLQTIRAEGIPDNNIIKLADNLSMRMKILTVGEVDKALKTVESDVDQLYALLVASVDEIYHEDDVFSTSEYSKEEISQFIENLSVDQFNSVRKWLDKVPTATIDVNFNCASCGERNEVALKGLINFFA